MNAIVRRGEFVSVSEARRHRFTLEEVLAMQDAGILKDRRNELIDGEIIHVAADGELHREWSRALIEWLAQNLDLELFSFLASTTLPLGLGCAPSPDIYLFSNELRAGEVNGDNVLLIIEEADSLLKGDLKAKPRDYARYGVREYWAIDLKARRLHVHRGPSPDGYASVEGVERDQEVCALFVPGLKLRLSDLPRVG